jgi:predicted SAM-dependent methyltransferase
VIEIKILDIGSGGMKYKGNPDDEIIGLDLYKGPGIDIVWNLEKTPLPFKTNEFDMVVASHVLEHIKNFFPLIGELHRIIKPGGILKVWVPHASDLSAFGHVGHVRYFTVNTFNHFTNLHPENKFTKARFKIRKVRLFFVRNFSKFRILNWLFYPLMNFNHKFYEKILCRFIPAIEMYVELEVIK